MRKPVFKEIRPINWTQPVSVIPTGPHQRIPLTFTPEDDYLLIINNLETAPHRTRTVHLTAESVAGETAPANCDLQNFPLPPQSTAVCSPLTRTPAADSEATPNLSPAPEPAAKERSFYLFVTDGNLSDRNQYSRIKGRLLQQSPRVAVYLDEQQQAAEAESRSRLCRYRDTGTQSPGSDYPPMRSDS